MVDPVIIVIGIIFIIIVAMIIVGLFYFNRVVPAQPLITDFGLTIRTPNNLYMSIENINIPSEEENDIFPIITLKSLATGQPPEPTEGWYLDRVTNATTANANLVTFFNPSNSGYITYTVDANNNIVNNIIRADAITKPPDPVPGVPESFRGWFEVMQNSVDKTTTFKSLYPGPIRGQPQYLIAGNLGQVSVNPNLIPVTIGIPTNNNNIWIVG